MADWHWLRGLGTFGVVVGVVGVVVLAVAMVRSDPFGLRVLGGILAVVGLGFVGADWTSYAGPEVRTCTVVSRAPELEHGGPDGTGKIWTVRTRECGRLFLGPRDRAERMRYGRAYRVHFIGHGPARREESIEGVPDP